MRMARLWARSSILPRENIASSKGLLSELLDKTRCCMGVGKEYSGSASGEKVTVWSDMSMRQLSF